MRKFNFKEIGERILLRNVTWEEISKLSSNYSYEKFRNFYHKLNIQDSFSHLPS